MGYSGPWSQAQRAQSASPSEHVGRSGRNAPHAAGEPGRGTLGPARGRRLQRCSRNSSSGISRSKLRRKTCGNSSSMPEPWVWHGRTARASSSGERRGGLGTPVRNLATSNGTPSLPWRDFLRQARGYLASARSPHLVPLLAVRAERLYGIPRAKAEARIRGRKWSRRREHRATPLGVVDSLPVEGIVADGNGRLE